jgi:hypothetical protein
MTRTELKALVLEAGYDSVLEFQLDLRGNPSRMRNDYEIAAARALGWEEPL